MGLGGCESLDKVRDCRRHSLTSSDPAFISSGSIIDKILEATCCHRVQRSLDFPSILTSQDRADIGELPTDPGTDRWSRLFQSLLKEKLANYPDSLHIQHSGAANGEKNWTCVRGESLDDDGSQDSEISRKVLRVVEIFSEALARQVANAADVTLQCCVWGPVLGLLRTRQAVIVWQELLLLFPKLVSRHAGDLLGKYADGHIIREVLSWLMCMAAFDDREIVRQQASSIIRLLLKACFNEHGGLVQVKVISTMALMDILEFRVRSQEMDSHSTTGCHSLEHSFRRSKSVCTTQSKSSSYFELEMARQQKTFNRSETLPVASMTSPSYDAADLSPRAKVDSPSKTSAERYRRQKEGRRSGDFLKDSWSEDLEILKRPGSPSFATGAHTRLKTSGILAWTAESLEKLSKSLIDLEAAQLEQICKQTRCQQVEGHDRDARVLQALWEEEVRGLGVTLRHVFHSWCAHHSLMGRSAVDRVLVAENCLGISKACLHVPDLSIQWLVRLSQSYREGYSEVFLPEAAQCLVVCAGIIIQHLMRWANLSLWGPNHLRTLQTICPDLPVLFPHLLEGGCDRPPSAVQATISTHSDFGLGALSLFHPDVQKENGVYQDHENFVEQGIVTDDRGVPADSDFLDEKIRNKLANALIQISKERISVDSCEEGVLDQKNGAPSEYLRSSGKTRRPLSAPGTGLDKNRIIGFGEVTLEKALEHLDTASVLFRTAGFFEAAAELIEVTMPVYKWRKEYKELIKCHSALASVSSSMCAHAEMWDEPTTDAIYFRVGFLGEKFGPRLTGKQFIYREDKHTHLSDLMERIGKFYEKNLRGQQFLRIISDPNQIDPTSLLPGIGYLQITPVEPLFEREKANPGSKTLIRRFYFSTRLSRSTSDHVFKQHVCSCGFKGALQGRRKTTLTARGYFPNLVGRLEVVQSQQRVVSLLEYIVDLLESWTRKLRSSLETAAMQLRRILQGVLTAMYTHHILTVLPICYRPAGVTARSILEERRTLGDDSGNNDLQATHSLDDPSTWKPCSACRSVLESLNPGSADREQLEKAVTQFLATVKNALKVNSECTDKRDWRVQASLSDKFQRIVTELSAYVRRP